MTSQTPLNACTGQAATAVPTQARHRTPRRTALAAVERPFGQAVIEIVIPVYNEQAVLERSVRRVRDFVRSSMPFHCLVTIADNASTDASPEIGRMLARELDDVTYLRLEEKGRGRALRTAWSRSDADVVVYMDVDLSTDLRALAPLVAPLVAGHSALAIGSRLARGSHVTRGPKREVISRCYNRLLRATLHARFSDAQCGFKAIRRDVASVLLPQVQDQAWFFDTELLVLAERSGLRIYEVPVDWVDDPDSRVDILTTAMEDLRGMWRIRRTQPARVVYGALRTDTHTLERAA
jgi:glycosyltransferase involved in cell wall biosynthesis